MRQTFVLDWLQDATNDEEWPVQAVSAEAIKALPNAVASDRDRIEAIEHGQAANGS